MPGPVGDGGAAVALMGNPNVGKSTVFNALTHLHQHTGNWPGKTVEVARGTYESAGGSRTLVDLPGTYSLLAHSAEEEVARDFLCFGEGRAAVVVCDASCLERNLTLVLQVLGLMPRTLVCVNLMDEAERRGVRVDLPALSRRLGVPVVGASAARGEGLEELKRAVDDLLAGPEPAGLGVPCPAQAQRVLPALAAHLRRALGEDCPGRWLALRLLEGDAGLEKTLRARYGWDSREDQTWCAALETARAELELWNLPHRELGERLARDTVTLGEEIARACVTVERPQPDRRDRMLDGLLTRRATGVPVMLALLALIFWLTIVGANGPSELLSALFARGQAALTALFQRLNAPDWLHGALVLGMYRTLGWVISVMLPPMAIFFPLFTLLEDLGYLPRVAFVLDHAFQRSGTCGKQALTICMGFGCNAVGVTGCRIIDSPRERLIAVLTNSLVPCNGRFPTVIALLTMFFVGTAAGPGESLLAAGLLTGVILLSVGITLFVSRLLSSTVLRGVPSSFALELPPYRLPRVGQVLARSVLDRTVFVLGRAAAVAAPAGLVIWTFANVTVGGQSVLARCTALLDPLGRFLGMDGAILMAFLLGFPANEIVLPVLLMAYLATGSLTGFSSLEDLRSLLLAHGWTGWTAACTLLFSLFHWPCSTTCLTIARETGSRRWTALAVALPTLAGAVLCAAVAAVGRIFA